MQIHAYLQFPGTCQEAFTFYKDIFQGEITSMVTHEESPPTEIPIEWRGKIMHAGLKVDGTVLMGADLQAAHYTPPTGIDVSLAFKNPERAKTVFTALAEGGKIRMEMQKTFWAKEYGMVTDRFGIPWMINCE